MAQVLQQREDQDGHELYYFDESAWPQILSATPVYSTMVLPHVIRRTQH
ncbi:hypothetical protein [Halomonas piscis]|nr:hypothetical protein [Halomonas piscis]